MKLVSASIELQALTSKAAKVGHGKDCKALDCSLAKFFLPCNTRIAGSLTCSLVAEHAEALPAHQKTWPSRFLLFLFALGFRVAELRLSGRPFVNAGIGASNFKTGQNYLRRNSSRWGRYQVANSKTCSANGISTGQLCARESATLLWCQQLAFA